MTPSFFSTPARLADLRAAAAQIEGTPFFANSEAPGPAGGIDCVRTLHFVYRTCGAIGPIDIPRQAMDYGHHAERSRLIDAFDTWPELVARFACVWRQTSPDAVPDAGAFCPGDALCFTSGRVPHHGGVLLEGGEVLHALRNVGVHRMRLEAFTRGRRLLGLLAAVYRPLPLP